MKLEVRLLTAELWTALEALFGPQGASNGCWCMYWRIGAAYRARSRDLNKSALRHIVKTGPPPGLLAFDGDLAVGWCQLTPRGTLPYLHRLRKGDNDEMVWSISCFYVRRGYRKRGVTAALIQAALETAKRGNAVAVEAYPVDTRLPKSTSNLFTGAVSTFTRAGFRRSGRLGRYRLIVRRTT